MRWRAAGCLQKQTDISISQVKKRTKHTSALAKSLTSALCMRSCQLMASHHVSNSFFAPGLSHANGHVMPLQRCTDVDVEANAETLNLIQEAGHLQNMNFNWCIWPHFMRSHSHWGRKELSLCAELSMLHWKTKTDCSVQCHL